MAINNSAINKAVINGAGTGADPVDLVINITNNVFLGVDINLAITNEVQDTNIGLFVLIQSDVVESVNLVIAVQSIANETSVGITLSIENQVFDNVSLSLPIQNQVVVPGAVGPNPSSNTIYWDFSVILGGVDVTSKITGQIRVDREEGAAAIADFELLPFAGVIDVYSWIGQTVVIDFIERDSTGIVLGIYRMFTGIVNAPKYDPSAGTTIFNCTDNLQEQIESTPRDTIKSTLVGSRWSEHIFEDPEDNWSYHLQLLRTIPASYDFDVFGNGQLKSWANTGVDFTYTEDDIFFKSIDIEMIVRREVLNSVKIELQHRTSNRWERKISGVWIFPKSFKDWLRDPDSLPTKDLILDALDADGWIVDNITFTNLPPTGPFYFPGLVVWLLSEFAKTLTMGVNFVSSKRWLQTNTEKFEIVVESQESINKHGRVQIEDTYAITGDSETDWENRDNDLSFNNPISIGDGFTIDRKFAVNESVGDVDLAIETAIAVARNTILSSHRTNTLQIELIIQPLLSLTNTVSVVTTNITGTGKVNRLIHIMDVQSGDATTQVSLAISQPNVGGQIDDAITSPGSQFVTPVISPTVAKMPPLVTNLGRVVGTPPDSDTFRGYVGNNEFLVLVGAAQISQGFEVYEERFVVEYPEVGSTERDELISTSSSVHRVAIPQDNLNILG